MIKDESEWMDIHIMLNSEHFLSQYHVKALFSIDDLGNIILTLKIYLLG